MGKKLKNTLIAFLISLVVWSCGGEPGTEGTAKKYIEAWRQFDLRTLNEMTSPDVVLEMGRGTLAGKRMVLDPVEFAAGAETELEFNNIVVRGDTVEFEMVERSGIITACGFDQILHYPWMIFENGLLVRKGMVRDIPDVRLYTQQLGLLRIWIEDSRPDIYMKITDESGRFKINRQSGELMLMMAKAWQESKLVD